MLARENLEKHNPPSFPFTDTIHQLPLSNPPRSCRVETLSAVVFNPLDLIGKVVREIVKATVLLQDTVAHRVHQLLDAGEIFCDVFEASSLKVIPTMLHV